jgi:peptidoglycan/LPS O-acetylase OafA/YrhL
MKKAIIIFVIAALVLLSFIVWIINSRMEWNMVETMMVGVGIVVVGFAVYLGIKRVKSAARREPPEDELSKKVMTRASSISYYISIYLWLIIMYFSDRIQWETHTLIGAGILGMAVILLLSWLGVRLFGYIDE